MALSLSAVTPRHQPRRQHPPDHANDRGRQSYRTWRPEPRTIGATKKVTWAGRLAVAHGDVQGVPAGFDGDSDGCAGGVLADVGQGFLDGAVSRALRWFGPILSLHAAEVEGDVVAAVALEPGDVGEPGLERDGGR